MVFGGSQGARTINHAITDALPRLLDDQSLVVLHGTGAQHSREYDAPGDTATRVAALNLDESKLARYKPLEYFSEIETFYAAADLLICRGGAGTLNELLTCGKPSIIIPKSSLAGEHQAVNALALAKTGAAEVLFEQPVIRDGKALAVVDSAKLTEMVSSMIGDRARLDSISRAAYEMRVLVEPTIYADSVSAILEHTSSSIAADRRSQPAWGNIEAVRLAGLPPSGVLARARKLLGDLDEAGIEAQPNIRLLRYLADIYLVDTRWQVRNVGIKLVGLTRYMQRREMLIELAGNRRSGQNGFIRRNAVTSLAELGVWDETLEALLSGCLSADPYYEVRVEAARSIVHLKKDSSGNKHLTLNLLANLPHPSLEVRWSCLEALGVTAEASDLMDHAEKLALHPNWKIRQALLAALETMIERRIITTGDPLFGIIDKLIPTCTDFNPSYPLKRSLNRLRQLNLLESGEGNSSGKGEQ
jgi:UDP-N-acetylglucosamine--N-acetylmuramyl-(pentapeptide) pyrophosphoryl-undecaprenol N-acetylglucosamine transferase